MTDIKTLEEILIEHGCDEYECWCSSKPQLLQALNLYIEEKTDKEIYIPIRGYDKYYQVSNRGNVRSISGRNGTKLGDRVLKPSPDKKGYLIVSLSTNNKSVTRTVHRLVAENFISNPNGYVQVNHKDGNKQNNNVENLEWCTPKQNINHFWNDKRVANEDLIKSLEDSYGVSTECKRGHPMSGYNVLIYSYLGKQHRKCRECSNISSLNSYHKRKQNRLKELEKYNGKY